MESMIIALNGISFSWYLWMLTMAWQVAIVVGIVWVLGRFWARASGAWKHALWMVVLLKLVLPPSLTAPWSIMTMVGDEPSRMDFGMAHNPELLAEARTVAIDLFSVQTLPSGETITVVSSMAWMMMVWALVALGMFVFIARHYGRYAKGIRETLETPSGELQSLFEAQLSVMGMANSILLRESREVRSPAVFGVVQAIVVVPTDFAAGLTEASRAAILRHELAHVKRRDLLTGWFSTVVVCVYWFHPLVWWTHFKLRHTRELACDDAALQSNPEQGEVYVETMLSVSEQSRLTPVVAGFHGIMEPGGNLKQRIRAAMEVGRVRRMSAKGIVALLVCMAVLIPLSAWESSYAKATELGGASGPSSTLDDAKARRASRSGATAVQVELAKESEKEPPTSVENSQTPFPQVVSISPSVGSTNVDPALKEIRVTFDRDMAKGFSWTGGKPYFPELGGSPFWIDDRTCALPVKLKPAKYYRLGLNSTSFGNFRSVDGKTMPPQVIYFSTKGYELPFDEAMSPPKVVELSPAKPTVGEETLTMRFDQPMGGGMSMVTVGEPFPKFLGKPQWSEDRKTLSVKVKLELGVVYKIGLNGQWHINFQSEQGIPVVPKVWTISMLP